MTKRRLPPLNSIKAFEAAAHHLSFTKAANDLCVTQGAISRQVKQLEDHLGIPLFTRHHRQLTLTEKGQHYFTHLSHIFDQIESVTNEIDNHAACDVFTINILPSLSNYWLIPRIQQFKDLYPDLHVRMISGDGFTIAFDQLDADIAIRGNDAPFPNVTNDFLMDETMQLVCHPNLLAGKNFTLKQLVNYPLLEHTCRPDTWEKWWSQQSLPLTLPTKRHGFEHFFMLIEAACQNMGFAFIPDFMVADLLANGKLINPLNIEYKTRYSYYLLYPEKNRHRPNIQRFRQWIKQL